jgi:NitT/TauT family transport system substrate-binding protein
LRDEFFARAALDPDIVRGLDQLMVEAVNFRYLQAPLAAGDFAELVQVPLK